ncbi:tetratricopeptide repeat protein [Kaistella palustris]|uniref:tetratricopeptide repeat protein n=1 Tax=Kaistella palustris TaxID=493376 RepID=UPI000418338E|nr:tetratricopeptide repeat protein [Kaistella palustris]
MKKEKVNMKTRALAAAAFFGALSFGYAQNTDSAKALEQTEAAVQTAAQNPAITALKKQTEANPEDTEALVKLATAYQEAQDWTNALGTWQRISKLLPDWAPSYYSQAYVYQNMKDEANAQASYEKYIAAVKPEELEANKKNLAYAHFFVAYKLQESDKEAAKQHIAKSLEYDPTNAEALKVSEFVNK